MKNSWLAGFLVAVVVVHSTQARAAASDEPSLVVHEWGTLTSKHFDNGIQSGGMNVIEPTEALPDFVHRIKDDVLRSLDKSGRPADANQSVTMRLETPVLYFYPSQSFDLDQSITVSAEFRGGLLNEFYPDADTTYEGIRFHQSKGAERAETSYLTDQTVGTLRWWDLSLGGSWPWPKTEAPQWVAPRQVNAADVRARNGESERYLFYRGVARLPSLLRTRHDVQTRQVTLLHPEDPPEGPVVVPKLWFVRVGPKGGLAFDEMGSLTLTADTEGVLTKASAGFPDHALKAENVGRFRSSLRDALIANGLFADEAEAMLNTWERAYFRSQGTRIMFIVPTAWLDRYLPLTVSVPAEIVRVYIGRIDLDGI